jgi:hypothetical protein
MRPSIEVAGPAPSMKENTGASAKRRRQKRLATYGIGILGGYVMLMTIYEAHFAGMFVADIEIDPETGQSRVRRRPQRHKQKLNPNEATYVRQLLFLFLF